MNAYILDTYTLTLAQRGHVDVCRRIQSLAPPQLAMTVISIEEQLTGWYTLLRRNKDPAKLAPRLSTVGGECCLPRSMVDSSVHRSCYRAFCLVASREVEHRYDGPK